jgi:hypothetical protein
VLRHAVELSLMAQAALVALQGHSRVDTDAIAVHALGPGEQGGPWHPHFESSVPMMMHCSKKVAQVGFWLHWLACEPGGNRLNADVLAVWVKAEHIYWYIVCVKTK